MFDKLKTIFGKPSQSHSPQRPNTPLEILMPEDRPPPEPPKIAGKILSFLVASPNDINTIEIQKQNGHVHSTDKDLKQFLALVAGAKQLDSLVSHCESIMFKLRQEGSLGTMACIQQGQLYSFIVFERLSPPTMSWEIHRSIRMAQQGAPGDAPKAARP